MAMASFVFAFDSAYWPATGEELALSYRVMMADGAWDAMWVAAVARRVAA
jgi:hypothetical protein